MQESTLETPIGQIVAEKLSRSRVFEQYGLDYCCGGHVPLSEACKEKGIDADEILSALTKSDAEVKEVDSTDWREASVTKLADHIEATHHVYLRKELPRLSDLMEKVVNAHSERHPELTRVAGTLSALTAELTQHLAKEEQVLFPIIRQMDTTGETEFHCGDVANPIRVMEMEHNNAGNALSDLKSLTNGYQPPEDGCTTYQALLQGLAELEFDIHQHILKESSILFPRAIALEEKLRQ
ncbi:MAG: iron-sulfur cluster repair di-iron protein [candidate division Zixibacteria bacterium]|nr:iron-sulfur cluster repair di-iron protein [candidate division Zixibacteria bacterium]MDH3937753.1 iron-sulfur cluster repair di-iron protein [candidate division Zixibacteria bacterium]MDH4032850.1 iron-sulfur cluster repair di-iron protein [candidate division Zixibacteria bacterium]